MHAIPFACSVLTCLVLQLGPSRPDVVKETLPDGVRVEREVVRDESGELVDHGAYKSWYPGGSVKATGIHENGQRSGDWAFYHANGQLEAQGAYKDDRRVGKWETFHANGQLASAGVYRRGLKVFDWIFYDEEGRRLSESGEYAPYFEEYPDGAPKVEGERRLKFRYGEWRWWYPAGALACAGEYKNDRRTGTWTWYWPDGGRRYQGDYDRDERSGPFTFWHPNGAMDPAFLSGIYRKGKRRGPLKVTARDLPPVDLAGLADPAPYPGLADADYRLLEENVQRVARGTDAQREQALRALAEWQLAVVPVAIRQLLRLDLTGKEDRLAGYRIAYALLAQATGGHVFAWSTGDSEEDADANRRTILRWHTLWAMKGGDEGFWERVRATSAEDEPELLYWLAAEDFEEPLASLTEAAEAAVDGAATSVWKAPPIDDLLRAHGGQGTAEAVGAALAWLAAHQTPAGSWDTDGFHRQCDPEASAPCDGYGHPSYDVGVTGLALLTFLTAGNTTRGGPYQEVVAKAVEWLHGQQDTRTGLIGRSLGGHDFLYGHAIATMALVEASVGADHPLLEKKAQVAVDAILRARNPYTAWRYEAPPNGESDTSMTAWMVSALATAKRHGFRADDEAFDGAIGWIDHVTDQGTGRVGYVGVGELSARTTINQHYDREIEEALTAAGLWVRLAAGQDAKLPVARKHVDLLLTKLPVREADKDANPLYYWYYGTYALFQVGGKAWDTWNAAMKRAVLDGQRKDGDATGSWDPNGPWGYAGGRVYATALSTLCLQVYYRHERFAD